jgi:hypothetical protein
MPPKHSYLPFRLRNVPSYKTVIFIHFSRFSVFQDMQILFSSPEDGGRKFVRNVDISDYTTVIFIIIP